MVAISISGRTLLDEAHGEDLRLNGPARYEVLSVPQGTAEGTGRVQPGAETETTAPAESDTPLHSSTAASRSYGLDAAYFSGSGPLSNTDLLLWLKSHSGSLSDQLRERMYEADVRNKLVEDLSYLKAQITETASGEMLLEEAQKLMAAYEGTPFAEETRKALSGILDNKDTIYDKDELSTTTGKLESAIDKFGKDDQMDMIYIQELTSRINEIFGLGSNLISSSHDTLKSIIGNLGR